MLLHLLLVLLMFWCGEGGHVSTRLISQQRVIPRNIPDDFFCQKDGDKLCASDLKGYFVCSKWGDVDDYFPCPYNMQCSCHLNKACKADPICKRIDQPFPMYRRAEFLFDGKTEIQNYERSEVEENERVQRAKSDIYPLQGRVRQDVRRKRFVQLINKLKDGGRTFEIIVPHKYRRGKFFRYTGDAHKNCKKEVIDQFRPFALDLSNYIKDANMTKKIVSETEDTWEYKIAYKKGEDFIRESWKWVLRQVSYTRQSKPIQSVYFRDGDKDANGLRFSETQEVNWAYRRLQSDRERWSDPAEKWYDDFFPYAYNWYEIPWHCQYL